MGMVSWVYDKRSSAKSASKKNTGEAEDFLILIFNKVRWVQ